MARFAEVLSLAIAFAARSAAAQGLALNDDETARASAHRVGTYEGVAPSNTNPPAVKVPAGVTPPQVTWPGFQILAQGGSRIFLQLTAKAETEVAVRTDQVVMVIKNARIAGRNNRRALETRFFNTPVNRAYLRKRGGNIALVLELRGGAIPTVSSQQASSGYYFIFLDFPAGQYLPSKTEAAPSRTNTGADKAREKGEDMLDSVNNSAARQKGLKPAAQKPLSDQQMRAIEEEKPPILQHKARGSIRLGR
jgi:hypothetical protein